MKEVIKKFGAQLAVCIVATEILTGKTSAEIIAEGITSAGIDALCKKTQDNYLSTSLDDDPVSKQFQAIAEAIAIVEQKIPAAYSEQYAEREAETGNIQGIKIDGLTDSFCRKEFESSDKNEFEP